MEQVTFIPIPLHELVGEITKAVRTELEARASAPVPQADELLSRKDAAKVLGITLPTLRHYTRKGLVKGYRIGARVRYKRSEVIGALQAMQVRMEFKTR